MTMRCTGVLAAGFALLMAGCSTVHTETDPKVDISKLSKIYVEHRLSDGHHIDELIARELRRRGYDASAGPLTLMPDGTQAIIVYEDTWTFDFTTYLIELDVALEDAKTGKEIGVGRKFHPSIFGQSAVSIVDSVLKNIFPAKQPPLPPLPPATDLTPSGN